MKFRELIIGSKHYKLPSQIEQELSDRGLNWLIDAEFENAIVEIQQSKVIWYMGSWYNGDWYGDIWYDGGWYNGTWHQGEWHNGKWHSGTWLDGIWRRGEKKS